MLSVDGSSARRAEADGEGNERSLTLILNFIVTFVCPAVCSALCVCVCVCGI